MIFASIELKTKCPKCDNPLMLNGPTRKALCHSCQHTIKIHPMIWKSILGDLPEEMKHTKNGQGHQSTTLMAEMNRELLAVREHPVCPSCETPVAHLPRDITGETRLPCRKCGAENIAAPPPSWLKKAVPEIAVIINALTETPVGAAAPAAGKPVIFTCPACKGSLKVDGSDRMVDCEFCGASIYLPDDLWLRMHPVKIVKKWYLGFDEGGKGIKQAKLDSKLLEAAYDADSDTGLEYLKKGADPNAADADGRTVLFFAAATDAPELVSRLLEEGAEPDTPDNYGTTALNIASYNGYGECVNLLLKYPVDINRRNKVGVTALYAAAKMGHSKIVKTLLAKGADPSIPNEEGETPASKAKEFGHDEVVRLLGG